MNGAHFSDLDRCAVIVSVNLRIAPVLEFLHFLHASDALKIDVTSNVALDHKADVLS